jgi:hypothetical protein
MRAAALKKCKNDDNHPAKYGLVKCGEEEGGEG